MRRLSATDAVRTASSWKPKAWPVDRMAALEELRQEPLDGAEIVWLSDGVADGPAAREAASRFAQGLAQARSASGVRRAAGAPRATAPAAGDRRRAPDGGSPPRWRRPGPAGRGQSARSHGRGPGAPGADVRSGRDQSGGAVRAAARSQQPYRALRARAPAGDRRRGSARRALAAPRGRPGWRVGGAGAPAVAVGAVLHRARAGVPGGDAPRLGRPADRRRGVGDRPAGRRPGQQRRPRATARLGRQGRGAPALRRTPARQCR